MINHQGSHILFRLKSVELTSELIQGTFPNYTNIIPKSYNTKATVNLSELMKAIRIASIFSAGDKIIRLEIMPKKSICKTRNESCSSKITISARNDKFGDNRGEVNASVKGKAAKIAFNSKYLLDVLGVLTEEEVALETTDTSSPGVIRQVGRDNYIHVIMPMFVQW